MTRKRRLSPLITHEKPKTAISEEFRGIRTNISFSSVEDDIQTLIITSEKPAVGKSTITANVAITYAQAGYKTLIIDGDMRKPTQHYIFNVENINGLSTLIVQNGEKENPVISTFIENLFLLPSGPIPPNPSELIASNRFAEIFKKLKTEFDIILVDTPPVIAVTDAQVFSRLTENAVLVIDVENNNRDEILKSKNLIKNAGGKILGVILNKVPEYKSTSNYDYYYEEK